MNKNDIIDLSLIAAKIATLNDEKSRMAVSGVSLVYKRRSNQEV